MTATERSVEACKVCEKLFGTCSCIAEPSPSKLTGANYCSPWPFQLQQPNIFVIQVRFWNGPST